ncbi:type II toxin-antitoxin system HicB family antitoxin [Thermus amyloliquefaciens]|uniref:type II toxin-antitoxin system HicB family antitoxin n=1 Tax=Thermus amyloliquefaciens TaxID=1449080 RepID=UPI00057190E0|nr:type II toxin-antitoxin system HicB family antitoxin [Thermus amyloliquefaciens]
MRQRFHVEVEWDEEGYLVAHVPELRAHTQAKSFAELLERLQEAIAVSLDTEEEVVVRGFSGDLEIEAA